MDGLEIVEKELETYFYVKVIGKITSFTHTKLQDRIFLHLQKKAVCLDFSEVTALASAGIGLLMGATKISMKFETKIYILNPSTQIIDSFEFTGIQNILNVIYDENEIE